MKKNVKRIVVAIVLSVITLFAFVSCSKAKTTLGGVKTGYANTLKSAKTVTQTMDYYDGKVKIRSRKSVYKFIGKDTAEITTTKETLDPVTCKLEVTEEETETARQKIDALRVNVDENLFFKYSVNSGNVKGTVVGDDEIKAFIGSELLNYYGVVSFTVNVNKDGYVTSAQYSFYTDVDSTKQVVVKFSYSF